MLTSADPLPPRPRRILVAGVSGSGKTTLAATIGSTLHLPHTEIDALFHGPHWTPRPEFEAEVDALVASPSWVTEWQYPAARETLAVHADLLVWLDLPFWSVTFPRVLRRTVRRRLRREVLWNGNVEPPLRTAFTDRDHIVRWAVSTRDAYTARIDRLGTELPDLPVVRLGTPREVRTWQAGPLARAAASR